APVVVVNNTFIKVLRPRRNPAPPGSQHAGFFQKTITYREYAQLDGTLGLALGLSDAVDVEYLTRWVLNINYLGKRGSFVQVQRAPQVFENLPAGYIAVNGDIGDTALDALLTQLDDVGPGTTFEHVNIYAPNKRLRLGQERLLHHVALPYRLVASSRGYSYYQLEDEQT
ncbi:MAG: hypothetical protein GX573_23270, partial [Chloroflexi bacterium]|nr:hypothetical protein [Chloroflexota bacterium]